MNVSYALARDHFVLAQAQSGKYFKSQLKRELWRDLAANLVLWIVIGFSLAMLFDALKWLPESRHSSAMMALGGLFLAALAVPGLQFYAQRRLCSRALDLSGPLPIQTSFSISPNGVTTSSRLGEWSFPFSEISSVIDTPSCVVVVMRSGYAIPVPSSAFQGTEMRSDFVSRLRAEAAL